MKLNGLWGFGWCFEGLLRLLRQSKRGELIMLCTDKAKLLSLHEVNGTIDK